VKCTQGAILDVAVDVRVGSPTYGCSVKAELSASNAKQLWVPVGLLHGFVTLQPNSVTQYKCTANYVPELDSCVIWDDPSLDIDWGFDHRQAVLSVKDLTAPSFGDFSSPFKYK